MESSIQYGLLELCTSHIKYSSHLLAFDCFLENLLLHAASNLGVNSKPSHGNSAGNLVVARNGARANQEESYNDMENEEREKIVRRIRYCPCDRT
jgi:hypothetical protein